MQKPLGTILRELAILLGIVFLVSLGLWLLRGTTEESFVPPEQNVVNNAQLPPVSPMKLSDTDGDGLFDWEEALWGTDALISDTDADGTSDGEEISLNRNPRKAGPGDIAQTPITIPIQKEVIQPVPRKPSSPKPQSENPPSPIVAIETKQSDDFLHTFGNTIGAPIMASATEHDAELLFWNSLVGNTKMDASLLEGLLRLANKYETLADKIAEVSPPEEARTAHLALVNGYRTYAKAIQILAQTSIGSYLSGDAMTAYSDSTLTLARAVVALSDLFYQKRIYFGKNEPGSVFVFPR